MAEGEQAQAPKVTRNAKGKRPQFYQGPTIAAEGLDHAMSMIMVLAQEFMVLRDRLDTVERLCAAKGVVTSDDIESFHPDQVVLEHRERERQRFFERLYYLARKQAEEAKADDSAARYAKVLKDIAKN